MKQFPSLLAFVGLVTLSSVVPADNQPRSALLLGSETNNFEPKPIDPAFPAGPRAGAQPRPQVQQSLCSIARPVCVHSAYASSSLSAPLHTLEQAYDTAVLALRLPAPLPDVRGVSPALDLYLVPGAPALQVNAETTPARGDRVAAHCVTGAEALDATTALRCIIEAATFALDAAEGPALRRGLSSYLAWLALGPSPSLVQAIEDAQVHPQLGLLSREVRPISEAGALFWAHLERRFGSGRKGELSLALFQQSRGQTEPAAIEWNNEPDVLDVLRNAFDNDAVRFAEWAVDFAIARMFLGDRSDGTHQVGAEWLGSAGRVRFDWTIDATSLPRNLASPVALEPFGCSYVWLDLAGLNDGARLAASFTWELPVRFKWSIVALDDAGGELQRFDVPYLARGNQIDKTLLVPKGAAALAFVGVNLGGIDTDYPFDPDHEPWEPHGYELYLTTL